MTAPTTPPASTEQPPSTTAEKTTGTTTEKTIAMPRLMDWLHHELLVFPRLAMAGHEREMRCEEYMDDGRLVLRVELPGVDPDKDVDITVADGVLTVRAERRETRKDPHHSEFFYGSLLRTFVLPAGADENAVQATYRDGVLEVTVPIPQREESGRKVPISRSGS